MIDKILKPLSNLCHYITCGTARQLTVYY